MILTILLVLFYPVHFKIKGNNHTNSFVVLAKISWLFNLFQFRIDYANHEYDIFYRILFIKKRLGDRENQDQDQEISFDEDSNLEDLDGNVVERASEEDISFEKGQPLAEKFVLEGLDSEVEQVLEDKTNSEDEPDSEKTDSRKEKNFNKIFPACKKAKELIKSFTRFWKNPVYKDAREHLTREIFTLIKQFIPYKSKINVTFSGGAPDLTGKALGIIAMFPFVYKNNGNIVPDFEADSAYVFGDWDIRGRLFSFKLVGIVVRLIFDKNCRKLFNDLRK